MISYHAGKQTLAFPSLHPRGITGALHPLKTRSQADSQAWRALSSLQRVQTRACRHVEASIVFSAALDTIPVRVIVRDLHLQFGEQLKCVGESEALGNWYSNAAPFLSWTDGDSWVHHSHLAPGSHKFKLVIVRDGGSMYWEEGEDRSIEVPEGAANGVLEVSCSFGDTRATTTEVVELSSQESSQEEQASQLISDVAHSAEAQVETSAGGDAADSVGEPGAISAEDSPETHLGEAVVSEELRSWPDVPVARDTGASLLEEPAPGKEPTPEENGAASEHVTAGDRSWPGASEPEAAPSSLPHRSAGQQNGNGFKTFGSATVAVLGEDSLIVTFSGHDEEDMATLAERLLAPKLPGRGL